MAEQFDIVIAGAGHNSLVAAAYLGKAGYSCLVLEARHIIGGNTMTEELTLPGYLHDTCSTSHAIFMQSPIWSNQELPLAEYGLEYINPDPASHVVFPDGTYITQWLVIDRTCEEISKFSRRDAETYRKMIADWRGVSPIFNKVRYTPAGWGPSIAEELAAHPQGAIWMRRQALSAWDIIDSAFEDWHVKSWMVWFAEGTLQPAERPGTGTLAYSFVAGRQRNGWAIPKGGSWSLPQALRHIIEDHGGTILTNQPVSRLLLEGGRCVGVETESGEQFRARHAVVSLSTSSTWSIWLLLKPGVTPSCTVWRPTRQAARCSWLTMQRPNPRNSRLMVGRSLSLVRVWRKHPSANSAWKATSTTVP